ncbi:hypothetical protein C5B42_01550 [Candidatus Cerribacteria bacterium 'Amazon FNV 2010 28 9']|uniref:Inositolphosphotransferase Aur1/Ipt1 domain-containing protein n=1 Tax=Candidatus Cerribacteria bacterium 'Amazon FNV 2010 28 9' TaxID=2081795 RepID=A0A317JTJ1_9BACT|nr:MAG: hypothetical protein C5B42_01550 [Candidatus Cerribacteria bacterium 'Amazon FNV 2010 28 9']
MSKHSKWLLGLTFLYMCGVSAYMLSHRMWFSPDQFFLVALLGMIFIGRAKMFIVDWLPFLLSYFSYEFLRGLVPFVSNHVHIWTMIRFDTWMFGAIPTIVLQRLFYTPSNLHWYDYVAVILYICHFVTPMIVGFYFWLTDRKLFKEFSWAFVTLSYCALAIYILFPAMPPWMASGKGYLPPIQEVTGVVMSHFLPAPGAVPTIYAIMDGNPVAAMPSLHFALPMLVFLFLLKKFKWKGVLFAPYVFGVGFAVIYLGEHYFMDVLAGGVLACLVFLGVQRRTAIGALASKFWKRRVVVLPAV